MSFVAYNLNKGKRRMQKTIKRIGLSLIVISMLSTTAPADAVSDALSGVESAIKSLLGADSATETTQDAGWVAEALRWDTHLENLKEEYAAKTGIRVGQDFVNKFKELKDFLTENNLDLFDLDLENPKSQIGQYAKELFESQTLFDDCNYDYMNDDQKRICKDRMVRGVQELATFSVYKDEIVQSIERIKTLTDKLGASEDIKGTADINAQINAQMAQLQVKKTQLDMMLANNQAREKVDRLQKEQLWKKSRGTVADAHYRTSK